MEISMAAQGVVFLFSCVVGAVLGVVYDVFRIIRIAFNSKWVSVFFQDFIFCIFSSFSIILLVYYTNSGIVRWFSLFGCFLCFVLYHMTVGRIIIFVSRKIINFIKKVLKFLKKITVVPVKIAVLFLIKQIKRLNKFIFKLCIRIQNNLYYKNEKHNISHSASYGFGLYTASKLKKNKKVPKYIVNMLKNTDKDMIQTKKASHRLKKSKKIKNTKPKNLKI